MSELRVTSRAHSITPRATTLIGSFAVIGASAVVLAIFAVSVATGGTAARLPALGVPIAVFMVSQLLGPARFSLDHLLAPKNWLLLLFAIQMVVIPLLIITTGFALGSLLLLPSDASITLAALLQSTAFVSCIAAFVFTTKLDRKRVDASTMETSAPFSASQGVSPGWSIIVLAILVGIAGLFLRFRSFSDLTGYFTGTSPVAYDLTSPASYATDAAQSISSLVLPFLGVGFALLACRLIEQARRGTWTRSKRAVVGVLVLSGMTAAYGLYNYNRGSFVMPVLAMVATYSIRLTRVRVAAVAGTLTLVAIAVIAVGGFRIQYFHTRAGVLDPQSAPSLTDSLQVYGQGPQFLGYMLDTTSSDSPTLGATLIASALSPVPVLGRDYRASSGTVIYNAMIYGPNQADDQIVPLVGELFWNFKVPGVVLGFALVGVAVALLQRAARNADDALGTYTANYIAFWVAYVVITSVSVLSQIFIYFMIPLLLILGIERIRRRQMKRLSG